MTRRDGRTVLALHASGGGFRGDDKGELCRGVGVGARRAAAATAVYRVTGGSWQEGVAGSYCRRQSPLRDGLFATNARVACPQNGGVRQPPPGTTALEGAVAPAAVVSEKAVPLDLPPGSPAASPPTCWRGSASRRARLAGLTAGRRLNAVLVNEARRLPAPACCGDDRALSCGQQPRASSALQGRWLRARSSR